MKNYELMSIWRTRSVRNNEGGYFETVIKHDEDAPLPGYNDKDMVDSESAAVGSPMDIVRYILKNDLKDYKLVKKTKKVRKSKG